MPTVASTLSADPTGAVESDALRAFRELQGRQRHEEKYGFMLEREKKGRRAYSDDEDDRLDRGRDSGRDRDRGRRDRGGDRGGDRDRRSDRRSDRGDRDRRGRDRDRDRDRDRRRRREASSSEDNNAGEGDTFTTAMSGVSEGAAALPPPPRNSCLI